MSRARTLAGAIGSDGALNVADVAGLAAVASSGSASDLTAGTLPNARLASGAAAANLGYTPVNKAGDTMTGNLTVPNLSTPDTGSLYSRSMYGPDLNRMLVGVAASDNGYGLWFDTDSSSSFGTVRFGGGGDTNRVGFIGGGSPRWWLSLNDGYQWHLGDQYLDRWKGRLDRAWDNYPCITIENDSGIGPQGEFRLHGIGGASGGDYSISLRSDGGFITGSDARRKTNIEPISNALARVLALEGVSFNIVAKDGRVETDISQNGKKLGFIAQQAAGIIPEATKYYPEVDQPNENGWASAYSIDYQSVVALLVEAIKEQQSKIDEQAQEIASLKARVSVLEGA